MLNMAKIRLLGKCLSNPSVIRLLNPLYRSMYHPFINKLLRPFLGHMQFVFGSLGITTPVVGRLKFRLFDGKTFYMESDGYDGIINMLYWNGMDSFEGETIPYFIKLVSRSRSMKIIDIGANTGLYAIIAAIENPNAKIYAFEPHPGILKYLKDNIKTNSLDNITAEQSALTNHDGIIDLYIPAGIYGDIKIPTSSSTLKDFRKSSEIITVSAIKLDSYCKEKNIKDVDLLKIDTEGTEHVVIEGGLETIKKDQPIIICEVLKGITERFLQELLDPIGYEYYWLSGSGPVKQETISGHSDKNMNYLFVTQRRKAALYELEIMQT